MGDSTLKTLTVIQGACISEIDISEPTYVDANRYFYDRINSFQPLVLHSVKKEEDSLLYIVFIWSEVLSLQVI